MPVDALFHLYRRTARLRWPKSLTLRLLVVGFLGTHLPLAAFVGWWATHDAATRPDPVTIALVLLAATLAGTAVTLGMIAVELSPFTVAVRALDGYAARREPPELPTDHPDEAGRLMASIQRSTERLEGLLVERERLAMSDPLTGLGNRRLFTTLLDGEARRIDRGGRDAAVALIDLDHFKSVNDTLGHAAGDQVLRHFAELFRVHVRHQDTVARIGGEEFAVLLPDTPSEGAVELLDRLRMVAAGRPIPGLDGLVVTFSAGVTPLVAGERPDAALDRADGALYAAKRAGRDRVVAEASPPKQPAPLVETDLAA